MTSEHRSAGSLRRLSALGSRLSAVRDGSFGRALRAAQRKLKDRQLQSPDLAQTQRPTPACRPTSRRRAQKRKGPAAAGPPRDSDCYSGGKAPESSSDVALAESLERAVAKLPNALARHAEHRANFLE